MNKQFERLIEYVINDEDDKARELFHDIVVAKSRQIYEEMMDQDELEEANHDDEEKVEEAQDDDSEKVEEDAMGGDEADDLIDDVSVEEEGMSMEGEGSDDMDMDMDMDAGGDGDIEGRLMDIEDKLDELMAEFEAIMGDEGDEEMDMDMDMDMAGDEEMDMEMGDEEEIMPETMPMGEAISLKAAPKPTTSEEGGINKKSPTAFNSGARGMEGKPVHTGTSQGGKHDAAGAYSNNVKDLISDVQNSPARSTVTQKPATKPHLAQATGVNTKSPL
jgi:hypothetical protein